LYLVQENTPSARNYDHLSREFNAKWQFADKRDYSSERGDNMQWIKANLSKTKFSSYEEVVKEHNEILKAYTAVQLTAEGQAFKKLADELQEKYGPYILIDVINEVDFLTPPLGPRESEELKNANGDTNSPKFKERYKKLYNLAVAYFKAPATVNARQLNNEFNSRWKYAYTPDENTPLGFDDRLEWLEKNWKKTKFKSAEQAKKELEAVLYAEIKAGESDESENYTSYLLETVTLYGGDFYSTLLRELMKNHPDIYYP
jgi:hypothetical protein